MFSNNDLHGGTAGTLKGEKKMNISVDEKTERMKERMKNGKGEADRV